MNFARLFISISSLALIASCGGGQQISSMVASGSIDPSIQSETVFSSVPESKSDENVSHKEDQPTTSVVSTEIESVMESEDIEPTASSVAFEEPTPKSLSLVFELEHTSFGLDETSELADDLLFRYVIPSFKANVNSPFSIVDGDELSVIFDIKDGANVFVEEDEYYFAKGGEVVLTLDEYKDGSLVLDVSTPEDVYGMNADGTYNALLKNDNPTAEEGKIEEYYFEGVEMDLDSTLQFDLNGTSLTVAVDPDGNNNAIETDDGIGVKTPGTVNVFLKVFADNVYKVWISGYQGKAAEILSSTFAVIVKNETYELKKNEYAQLNEGQIAEFMVERLTVEKGDSLLFTMNGKAITVTPDGSEDNNWRPNANGDLVINNSCINCGEIYLKAYEDRFEAWVFGYIAPVEPVTTLTYSADNRGLEEGALTDGSVYFAKVTYGDKSSFVSTTYDSYYKYLNFVVEEPLSSFYLIRCPQGTTLNQIIASQGLSPVIQTSETMECIYMIFIYVINW